MPRWLWLVPFGFLVLLVAFNGVRLGITRANITETAVIDHYAAQYLEDHARILGTKGALSDCLAVPGGQGNVWLEVRCSPQNGQPAFVYGVRRDGGLAYAGRDQAAPDT